MEGEGEGGWEGESEGMGERHDSYSLEVSLQIEDVVAQSS